MSRKRNYKKRMPKWARIVVVFVLLIASCGLLGLLSGGFENFHVNTWFKAKEQVFVDIVEESEDLGFEIKEASTLDYSAAAYMYADGELFEEKIVTKIGVPVKALTDYEKDNTFTVYVVDFDKATSTTKDIEKYVLTIEADTYDENDVEEWVYFDVNILVEKGQTLAFGNADDTILVACSTTSLDEAYVVYNNILSGTTSEETTINLFLDIIVCEA